MGAMECPNGRWYRFFLVLEHALRGKQTALAYTRLCLLNQPEQKPADIKRLSCPAAVGRQ